MAVANFNLPQSVIDAYNAVVAGADPSQFPGAPRGVVRAASREAATRRAHESALAQYGQQATVFLPLPLDPYWFPNGRVTPDEQRFVEELRRRLPPEDDNPWVIADQLANYRAGKIQALAARGGPQGAGSGPGASPLPDNPDASVGPFDPYSGLTPAQRNAMDTVRSMFPWIEQLGGPQFMEKVKEWIVKGFTPEGIVASLRQTPEWRAMFPGIFRPDGGLKMTEAQYLQRRDEYRQLLKQYGRPDYEYDFPADTAPFFEADIDPNELRDRLQIYDAVKRDRTVKDAFYVYAGMRVTDDDLYQAVVNPLYRDDLLRRYQQTIAVRYLDYDTFLRRAAEVGIDHVLEDLPPDAGQQVATVLQRATPQQLRDWLQALHMGPNGEPLSLSELTAAFEHALIGAAATGVGLELPSVERVEQLRQVGVNRARALEQYSTFAQFRHLWTGAVQRAGLGTAFTQSQFEEAAFLGSPTETARLQQALAAEKALSQASFQASWRYDRYGRLRASV